ncbi:MAG: RNA polymerase sigma factor [Sphingobium sp.]
MSAFEQHIPALRAWFRRRLRNAADVDDAVQDVWVRAQRHLGGGGVNDVRSYLFRSAHSVMVDRARRAEVRHEGRQDAFDEEMPHLVEEITPERVLQGKDRLQRVVERMREMPERTRDIFLLHRFEGVSYGEIARTMGISISAVEKHIMKALRMLEDEI